ncbi:MAG: acyltransferase family protein [Acidobacteriaceae bacterium]
MKKTLTGPGCLRLILALIVFASHGTREAIGTAAVDIFFALSGYWIFQMYSHKYSKAKSPYFTYIISRYWRLLPVFLLLNTATILLDRCYFKIHLLPGTWFGDLHSVFSNLFILGYNSQHYLVLTPAWSLDMEVQFYLIAPLLIWLAIRRPFTVLWASASISLFFSFFPTPLLTGVLVFFVIGLTAAATSWKPSPRLAALSLILLAVVYALWMLSPWRGVILMETPPNPLQNYNDGANALFALIAIPFALYTTTQQGSQYDATFGELSYIVYLLHWPIIVWFRQFEPSLSFALRTLERAALGIIVLALAYVILRLLDRPMNRLRARWVNRRIPAIIPASA